LDEIVVVRFHEEIVVPHADAAMARVGTAARLPVELPEDRSVARVHGPEIVGRRGVEHAVDHEDGSADLRGPAPVEIAAAFATPGGGHVAAATAASATATRAAAGTAAGAAARASGRPRALHETAREPREAEILHGRLVDLRERTVASAGVIARV